MKKITALSADISVSLKRHKNARRELVQAGMLLSGGGLSSGTTGNLSVRIGDFIICSPTGVRLSMLSKENLSVLSLDGNWLGGPKATKEAFIHSAMYQADSTIRAIVHLHSTFATAVSCLEELNVADAIQPLTPYLTMKAGKVSVIPYFSPGDSDLAEPVSRSVKLGSSVMLLRNHGSLIGASSLSAAVAIAEELEESARLQIVTNGLGVRRIPEPERAILFNL